MQISRNVQAARRGELHTARATLCHAHDGLSLEVFFRFSERSSLPRRLLRSAPRIDFPRETGGSWDHRAAGSERREPERKVAEGFARPMLKYS